jgi:surfeit locus 1 family protein
LPPCLGLWQLDRRGEKAAAIRTLAANVNAPPVAWPRPGADGEASLFRRSSVMCLRPIGWASESGRAADGTRGWRLIVTCAGGIEGPGTQIQLGIATEPDARPKWTGGEVSGHITYAPDHRPILSNLWSRAPRQLMLVADRPPPGLKPNAGPDLSAVPNNHLAYAVQWFVFAALAVVIYLVAVRRRSSRPTGASLPGVPSDR